MKYYSEKTDKLYDSEEALVAAENKLLEEQKRKQALKDERAARAKEVEDAIEHANQLMSKFVEDYGSFHTTVNPTNNWLNTLLSLFDL